MAMVSLRAPVALANIPTPLLRHSLSALVFASQSPYSGYKNVTNKPECYAKWRLNFLNKYKKQLTKYTLFVKYIYKILPLKKIWRISAMTRCAKCNSLISDGKTYCSSCYSGLMAEYQANMATYTQQKAQWDSLSSGERMAYHRAAEKSQ
jgi:hypothetical protein